VYLLLNPARHRKTAVAEDGDVLLQRIEQAMTCIDHCDSFRVALPVLLQGRPCVSQSPAELVELRCRREDRAISPHG
jgi:hypothetical protein